MKSFLKYWNNNALFAKNKTRLVELPAYLIGMFVVDILGRRLILNVTIIMGGISCLIAGFVPEGSQRLWFDDFFTVLFLFFEFSIMALDFSFYFWISNF